MPTKYFHEWSWINYSRPTGLDTWDALPDIKHSKLEKEFPRPGFRLYERRLFILTISGMSAIDKKSAYIFCKDNCIGLPHEQES